MAFKNAAYAPYLEALASIESGGNYNAIGPTTKNGDQAHGKYQVMGANVPAWTKMAYGQSLTPAEFRGNPDAQDAVAEHYFGSAMQKYGNPQDAASVWFTNKPRAQGANLSDGYNTGSEYIDKYNKALQAQGVDPQTAVQMAMDNGDGDQLPPGAKPTMQQGDQQDQGFFSGLADRFKKDPAGMIGNALSGVGAGLVTAANPYAGAALQAQFNARMTPKWGQVATDQWGKPLMGWIDVNNRTVTDANGKPINAGSDANNGPPDYEHMNKGDQSTVDRMLEGRQPMPTGRQLMLPYWKNMMDAADAKSKAAGGQGFDATNWKQRLNTATDFGTGGKSGQTLTGLDTLDQHIEKASNAVERLDNGQFPTINGIKNFIAANTNIDPARRDALKEVSDTGQALVHELGKAWKTGIITDQEVKDWSKRFNETDSKESQRRALYDFNDLIQGKRDALLKNYKGVMEKPPSNYNDTEHQRISQLLADRHVASDLGQGAGNGVVPAGGAAAAPPVKGAKLAPDGHYYVSDPNRPGKYLKVN